MVKKVAAAICGIALTAATANVAFNTPGQWGTLRNTNVPASFIVDTTLIGSTMKLTLNETVNGKTKVLSRKTVAVKDLNGEYSFTVNQPVVGGKDFHSLTWEIDDKKGTIAPFAIAPVINTIDPRALSAVKASGDVTAKNFTSINGISSVKAGESELFLTWTPSTLFIIVKGGKDVTIALDPANMKGGFRAFSQREVSVNLEEKAVSFNFYDRVLKEDQVKYSAEKWTGDMTGSVDAGVAVIALPWYEIGAKPFAGRQLGIYISSDEATYPEQADSMSPATWSNFILK